MPAFLHSSPWRYLRVSTCIMGSLLTTTAALGLRPRWISGFSRNLRYSPFPAGFHHDQTAFLQGNGNIDLRLDRVPAWKPGHTAGSAATIGAGADAAIPLPGTGVSATGTGAKAGSASGVGDHGFDQVVFNRQGDGCRRADSSAAFRRNRFESRRRLFGLLGERHSGSAGWPAPRFLGGLFLGTALAAIPTTAATAATAATFFLLLGGRAGGGRLATPVQGGRWAIRLGCLRRTRSCWRGCRGWRGSGPWRSVRSRAFTAPCRSGRS